MYPYKSRGCNNLLKAKNVYVSCKGNDKIKVQNNLNDQYELLNTSHRFYFIFKGASSMRKAYRYGSFLCIRVYCISLRRRHVRRRVEKHQKSNSRDRRRDPRSRRQFMGRGLQATRQRKSHLCIPRKEIARPQSQYQIHVSVSDLYIFPRLVHIFSCSRIGRSIVRIQYINRSKTHECGNFV
jgi:hypothetical protein